MHSGPASSITADCMWTLFSTLLIRLLIRTARSMTTLRIMTLDQTSEVARHVNDESIYPPLEVSSLLRCPRAVVLPLTDSLLTLVLQHPSRTPFRPNHHLIASLTLMLMVALVGPQLRRTLVDRSNLLEI